MDRGPFEHVYFHRRIGVVIVAPPKIGCSSVKHWMIRAVDPEYLNGESPRLHVYAHNHLSLQSLPLNEAKAVIADHPTIGFVRDAFARVRGGFIDKFVKPADHELFPPALAMIADAGSDPHRRLSFREFVEALAQTPDTQREAHFRSQASFYRDMPVTLHPIEQMGAVLRHIALEEQLGDIEPAVVNDTRKEHAGDANVADVTAGELHRTDRWPVVSELVDEQLRSTIGTIFAEDTALYEQAKAASAERLSGPAAGPGPRRTDTARPS